ncbi:MAG: PEGA domain-containing protein [Kofleriaceae bacterium]
MIIAAAAVGLVGSAAAQPDPAPAPDDVEIELEPDPVVPTAGTPAVKDPRQAKKQHQLGVQLIARGDYYSRRNKPDDAKTQYTSAEAALRQSIVLGTEMAVYLDLATALGKLGKLDEAAKALRALSRAQGVRADVTKKATAKLDELSSQIGFVVLSIEPAGTTVTLAGSVVGEAPLADALVLMPGTYTVAFAADGYQPREVELKVEAGSESERKIELEPIKIVVGPVKPKPDEPVDPTAPVPPPSRRTLYIGGGVTLGLVAIGTITGLVAVSRHGTFDGEDATPDEREDARSSGKRMALVTDLCLVGALVTGGYTAYHYLYKYRPALRTQAESRDKVSTKVDLVPWVQPAAGRSGSMVGAGLTGSF